MAEGYGGRPTPMAFADNLVGMDATSLQERFQFVISLPMKDTDKLYWVLNALLEVGNEQKIYFPLLN